jgi:hypothetical protein
VTYRDDSESANARADAIERELDATKHKLAATEAELATTRDQLAKVRSKWVQTIIRALFQGFFFALFVAFFIILIVDRDRARENTSLCTIDTVPSGAALVAVCNDGSKFVDVPLGTTPVSKSWGDWQRVTCAIVARREGFPVTAIERPTYENACKNRKIRLE